MEDLYLKFPDQATATRILYTSVPTLYDTEEQPVVWSQEPLYLNIDTIGVLYESGELDNEGNMVLAPVEIEGWHVNIRLMPHEHIEPLLTYLVRPASPRRTWF